MYNLHEEKIEYALGNRIFGVWQGKKAEKVAVTEIHLILLL